jgi:hypothetical protein
LKKSKNEQYNKNGKEFGKNKRIEKKSDGNLKPTKIFSQVIKKQNEEKAEREKNRVIIEWPEDWSNNGEPVIITLPAVKALPKMSHYTEIDKNVWTEDAEWLEFLPLVAEEGDFTKRLIEKYKGKFRGYENNILDDSAYFDFVNRLMKEMQHSTTNLQVFEVVAEVLNEGYESKFSSLPMFFQTRFENLKKEKENVQVAQNVPDVLEDNKETKSERVKVHMGHFCSRCYQYGCLTHPQSTRPETIDLSNGSKREVAVKKRSKAFNSKYASKTVKRAYKPCDCIDGCKIDACQCRNRLNYCEKECKCSSACANLFRGKQI